MADYSFYGTKLEGIKPKSSCESIYSIIDNPVDLYMYLSGIWSSNTCAPRLREQWSVDNKTKGQCSITSFLVQDIFGGEVYGIPLESGNFHCYNVISGKAFDLTSEQFGDRAKTLVYENNPIQKREVHFAKEEKRLRYELLKSRLHDRLVIAKSSLFSGVKSSEINLVIDCIRSSDASFRKNETILRRGNIINKFGLVLEGNVVVVRDDFWGNRELLTLVSEGQIFAESFACSSDKALNVSVVAQTDCRVVWFDANKFLNTCSNGCVFHTRIIKNMLEVAFERNLRLNDKLLHISSRTTRDKLLSYLSSESLRCGSPDFTIKLDRQQLADYLAVDRSAMCSELAKLKKDKLIDYNKNHFILSK